MFLRKKSKHQVEDEEAAGSGTVSGEPRNKVILRKKKMILNNTLTTTKRPRDQETKQSKYQKMMFRVGNSEARDYTAMN